MNYRIETDSLGDIKVPSRLTMVYRLRGRGEFPHIRYQGSSELYLGFSQAKKAACLLTVI